MDDDDKYDEKFLKEIGYDELLDDFFNNARAIELNWLKQKLSSLSVDNLVDSEFGLNILEKYNTGEVTYKQAIAIINKKYPQLNLKRIQ